MMEFLRGKASKRKLVLYACACSRSQWPLRTSELERYAIALVERFADGLASAEELAEPFYENGRSAFPFISSLANVEEPYHADRASQESAEMVGICTDDPDYAFERVRESHAELVREIFGPLPLVSNPIGIKLLPGTARHLCKKIYEDRAYELMPVLADALEEAGCEDPSILEHCRGPGPHFLGCWVVDLLLGKS